MHISYTISYAILYVRRPISYVKIQVLTGRTCNIVYDVVYNILRSLYDIVRATLDIAEKHTTSYVFLQGLASRTCDIAYDIVRFFDDVAYDVQCNIVIIRYRT